MVWNWEQSGWPEFTYDSGALDWLEGQFLLRSGEFIGAFKHLGPDDQATLKIELITDEAVKTSEIEGEILNRDGVQSSAIRRRNRRTARATCRAWHRADDGGPLQKLRRAAYPRDDVCVAQHADERRATH
jgi:Fic family protein